MIATVLAFALAQSPAPTPPAAPVLPTTTATVPWAVQFDMPSRITGRTYRIYVARPFTPPPKGGWPVVYVLGGDVTFPSLASQLILRSGGYGGGLVVGVAYPVAIATLTLRNRDLTPSQPSPRTVATGEFGHVSSQDFGGAEDFHRFMMEELRPRIAAAYPVDAADQSLIGYSLGGLFALNVLFHHPEAYRTYVAGSPSIWWNNREVLAGEPGFAAAVKSGRVAPRILITSNAWEQASDAPNLPPPGPKREAAQKATVSARMVDNARDLAGWLAALPGSKDYRVRYVLFPEETHETGIPASASRGLVFALTP